MPLFPVVYVYPHAQNRPISSGNGLANQTAVCTSVAGLRRATEKVRQFDESPTPSVGCSGGGRFRRGVQIGRSEAGFFHSALGFGRLHECIPDEAGAGILSHQHGDASINAYDIAVVPVLEGIKRVDEPVLTPCLAVARPNCT